MPGAGDRGRAVGGEQVLLVLREASTIGAFSRYWRSAATSSGCTGFLVATSGRPCSSKSSNVSAVRKCGVPPVPGSAGAGVWATASCAAVGVSAVSWASEGSRPSIFSRSQSGTFSSARGYRRSSSA